ncbi:carbohydrate-selective porin OprB [Burkholderia multivorans]|nr:carbohydrate-selective porin OprB [Burkholderia multivorans]
MRPDRFGVSYNESNALRVTSRRIGGVPLKLSAIMLAMACVSDAAWAASAPADGAAVSGAGASLAITAGGVPGDGGQSATPRAAGAQSDDATTKQASTDRPTVTRGIPSTDQLGVSHIGDVVPAPPPSARSGPLSAWGEKLNGWGITPVLNMVQMYLTNPGVGQQTGKHEALTFFTIGADFDMAKLAGFNGSTIHFQQLYVPFTTNLGWGKQVGDVLIGEPGPYVPKVSHLAMFTWEQKAFGDKLDFEFGKSNPGLYFAMPVCNQGYACAATMLQDNAGMNPPIYVNWGGRVRYHLTPEIAVQAGVWRSNPAFPFTNGYEWTDSVTDSNTWLANVTYRTTYATDPYPKSYELLFYHNTAVQTDPSTRSTHDGTSGLYVGGRQVIYRPDGGVTGVPNPTALSAFASMTASFDAKSSTGLAMMGNTGLILEAPFKSRPHDSYSLKLAWATVTPSEQRFLQQQNLLAGGTGYTVGRTQYALSLDANFEVTRSIIASPYIRRTWNTGTWGNPQYAGTPKNGIAAGILVSVFFDRMLGLSDH